MNQGALRQHNQLPKEYADGRLEQLRKFTASIEACRKILLDVTGGKWDLQARFPQHIQKILGTRKVEGEHSTFLRGIMDGCVDGQKRRLREEGMPYKGREEWVRQYCACMAPMNAELAATPEGRLQILDGNKVMKERVRKLNAICVDGVNNGREFVPPRVVP